MDAVFSLFMSACALFLFLFVVVLYFKHKIYQSWNLSAPLKKLVRHPALPALGLALLAMYLGFLLPAGFDKCFWKKFFMLRHFLPTMFFVVQPVLIFLTFYTVEKSHILQINGAAVFTRARAWVVALNVLQSCILSALLVFLWMVLTVSTDYSVLRAMSTVCQTLPEGS